METMIRLTLDDKANVYRHPDGRPVPRLSTILRDAGLFDYSGVPSDVRDFALDRGSKVHRMTALWDRGILREESLDSRLLPYLKEYQDICDEFEFRWEAIEEAFLEPIYWYGCTVDRFGRSKLGWTLLEIKTGELRRETEIQLAGQLVAMEPRLKELGINPGEVHRMAIELRGTGTHRKPTLYTDRLAKPVFLGMASAFHWKRNNLKEKRS